MNNQVYQIDVMIEDGTADGRNEEMKVSVPEDSGSAGAVIIAMHALEMKPGELIHMIHVGPPARAED
ncbi:hypothetical protein [Hyphomicrobium sp.]|uniref:hypothetical protein n=1 Tax=Hyphomicrobium sp. TaxID=82 RepID=UPI001D94916A|nr:hypothetical protein [Hyphomicrobium sp.]MBY0559846.1 hypothetical protein [Hyphomicrobium sp.]